MSVVSTVQMSFQLHTSYFLPYEVQTRNMWLYWKPFLPKIMKYHRNFDTMSFHFIKKLANLRLSRLLTLKLWHLTYLEEPESNFWENHAKRNLHNHIDYSPQFTTGSSATN